MLEEEGYSTVIAVSPCAPAWPAWWCDSCRSVPCSVYSRSDTAYLCGGCDTSIHSANSLARRRNRVPVQPIHVGVPTIGGTPAPPRDLTRLMVEDDGDDHFIGVEVDEYLDLVEFSSCEEEWKADEKEKGCHNDMSKEVDGVVPVNCLVGEEEDRLARSFQMGYDGFEGGIDYSSLASSHGHNVSPSSIETTPAAAENSMIAISSSHIMTYKETIELFSGPQLQMPQVFSPKDREARVLRYREKKKTRKFQKVIRYASRKAYAETRPRIKGRFAKRTDFDHQVDQIFVAPVMIEASYGVVPSY